MTDTIDPTTPEPALTVKQQCERIASLESTLASLESTLIQVEIIVERAMRKGYSPDAYELAEVLELDEEA